MHLIRGRQRPIVCWLQGQVGGGHVAKAVVFVHGRVMRRGVIIVDLDPLAVGIVAIVVVLFHHHRIHGIISHRLVGSHGRWPTLSIRSARVSKRRRHGQVLSRQVQYFFSRAAAAAAAPHTFLAKAQRQIASSIVPRFSCCTPMRGRGGRGADVVQQQLVQPEYARSHRRR